MEYPSIMTMDVIYLIVVMDLDWINVMEECVLAKVVKLEHLQKTVEVPVVIALLDLVELIAH